MNLGNNGFVLIICDHITLVNKYHPLATVKKHPLAGIFNIAYADAIIETPVKIIGLFYKIKHQIFLVYLLLFP